LRVLYLKRRFQIGFAYCRGPDSTDDDIVRADRVNDFPPPEDKLSPTALLQLLKDASSFRVLKANLRTIVDTESDTRGSAWITTPI